jgi:hypothetical protein
VIIGVIFHTAIVIVAVSVAVWAAVIVRHIVGRKP